VDSDITLLAGAVATPLLGRLGAGPRRRGVIIGTLGVVTAGSLLTVLPLPFGWLLLGRAAQGVGLGYAQTPTAAGYGFGLTTFEAGLVLVPFSVLGFVAGKVTPRVSKRIGASALLTVSALVLLGAFAVFALARSDVVEVLVAMAILGFGVGSFSAAMPAVILAVTPQSETSSAMSFNQVVRGTGFSIGSAVGGLVLAARTPAGHLFPLDDAYTAAAWIGVLVMLASAWISALPPVSAQHPAEQPSY
jgi:predicted MFS family arabinose efflux permease